MPLRTIASTLFALALGGCLVRASRYDKAVHDENLARDDAARAHETVARLREALATTQQLLQAREARVAELEASTQNLHKRLDEATALHQQLEKALERLGKNVGAMVQDKGALQRALDDAKGRLAELRAVQARAEAREAATHALALRLRAADKSQRIEVGRDDGQPVVVIPATLLFEPGHSELRHGAEPLLRALERALAATPGWQFRITDKIVDHLVPPPGRGRAHALFAPAALRASVVADHLVALGSPPATLSVGAQVDAAANAPAGTSGDAGGGIEILLVAAPAPAVAPSPPQAQPPPAPTAPSQP